MNAPTLVRRIEKLDAMMDKGRALVAEAADARAAAIAELVDLVGVTEAGKRLKLGRTAIYNALRKR